MAYQGVVPRPIGSFSAQGTRAIQATYEGAVFTLATSVKVSTVLFQLTAVTTPVTISFAVYQRATPTSTDFTLAFSGSFTPGAGGAQAVSVSVGPFGLEPGEILIIFGISSGAGSATMRGYGTQNYDGLNTSVAAATYPTTFSTAIAASGGPPTTIDASAQTASGNNVAGVFRFL
jgi:hypothetical protein